MILSISSAGQDTTLTLLDKETHDMLSTYEWASGRTLADGLLGHIRDLLAERSANFVDLTGIIILSGPGSFTSLRIAHTVANTLASSLHIPLASAPGDDWLTEALMALPGRAPGEPVWPFYGAEANITLPKRV